MKKDDWRDKVQRVNQLLEGPNAVYKFSFTVVI